MMNEQLKPCPFCGGDVYLRKDDDDDWWAVMHKDFSCPCEQGSSNNREEAIRAWNTRAAPKVKALEWVHGDTISGQPCSYANAEFRSWIIVSDKDRDDRWVHIDPNGQHSEEDWLTREECQTAAQADYEARILAALE